VLAWSAIGLVLVWVGGRLSGGAWEDVWIPNFLAEVGGLVATVIIVEGIVQREVVKPIRLGAERRLERSLEPLLVFMAQTLEDPTQRLGARPSVMDLLEIWPDLGIAARLAQRPAWLRSWIVTQQLVSERLGRLRDRYENVLVPKVLNDIDDFIDFVEREAKHASDDVLLHELLGTAEAERESAIAIRVAQSCGLLRQILDDEEASRGAPLVFEETWKKIDVINLPIMDSREEDEE
jgi:hypothetical protein